MEQGLLDRLEPGAGVAPLRRSRPADLPFLVDVLEMASRGHLERGPWDVLFPDAGERRRALRRMASGPTVSWCHTSLFHVAEADGEPGAGLVTFEPSVLEGGSLVPVLMDTFTFLGWSEGKVLDAVSLLNPFTLCFPDMPDETWIIENVGTARTARRRGLARDLLEVALAEGVSKGFERAQISCLIGNDAAQGVYERAGFEVVEEKRDAMFERLMGSPGYSRMTRTLGK